MLEDADRPLVALELTALGILLSPLQLLLTEPAMSSCVLSFPPSPALSLFILEVGLRGDVLGQVFSWIRFWYRWLFSSMLTLALGFLSSHSHCRKGRG